MTSLKYRRKDYNDNKEVIIIEDGKKKITLDRFVDNVFNDRIEITYIRGWIARQAMKLERWLNSFSPFAIAGVFVIVFVTFCGLMVLYWIIVVLRHKMI